MTLIPYWHLYICRRLDISLGNSYSVGELDSSVIVV